MNRWESSWHLEGQLQVARPAEGPQLSQGIVDTFGSSAMQPGSRVRFKPVADVHSMAFSIDVFPWKGPTCLGFLHCWRTLSCSQQKETNGGTAIAKRTAF